MLWLKGGLLLAKFRNWRLTSYLSESQIRQVLDDHSTQIKAFAYILHNKDVTDKGELKTPHYHILLCLHNANSLNALLRWFDGFQDDNGNDINTLAKVMNSRTGAFAYLTHNTCASRDKYQYPDSDIVSYNADFFSSDDEEDNVDSLSCALTDMLAGIPLNEIRVKYGRDFILHYCHIKALYNDIQKQEGGVLL